MLKNLLKLEKICVPVSEDYLRSGIQPDLNPSYRKIVTDWMLQVRNLKKLFDFQHGPLMVDP